MKKNHLIYLYMLLCFSLLLTACSSAKTVSSADVASESAKSGTAAEVSGNASAEEDMADQVETLSGSMNPGITNGMNSEAAYIKPYGLCVGPDGELLIVDNYANMLRLESDGLVYTLTGNTAVMDETGYPLPGYLNGSTTDAVLNRPRFAATSAEGAVIFSDTGNHCIRIISDGTVRLLAGTGSAGFADGPYDTASFDTPSGVAIGEDGTIYVADTLNHCIRTISADGTVSTLAGIPQQAGYQDGSNGEALFCEPNDIALGTDGALYVVDKGNQRIRRVTGDLVTTVAGSGSGKDSITGYTVGGYADGAALEAQFQYPTGLTIAPNGTIYIADTGNHCIRVIADGTVSTLAGSRTSGSTNGSLSSARFNQPIDVLWMNGGLCVSDSYNHVIRLIHIAEE